MTVANRCWGGGWLEVCSKRILAAFMQTIATEDEWATGDAHDPIVPLHKSG